MEEEAAETEMSESAPVRGGTAVLPLRPDCRLVCVEYPGCVTNVRNMLETVGGEHAVSKMFERRPVWSRNAVKANVDMHPDKMKLLLPTMAYYMLTGPWRSLWVKFGYDPRKTPEAKAYQVLDFRFRCGMKHGYTPNDMPVKAKRSTYNYSLPISVNKAGYTPNDMPVKAKRSTYNYSLPISVNKAVPQAASVQEISQEVTHPKPAPPRQMFYQFCDLEVESIKKLIQRNDGQEEECNERDGWCVPRTPDELRDIMSSMIKQNIHSKRPALFDARPKRAAVGRGRRSQELESGEEEPDEDDEDEEEFQPSEGSDNEMETEILDYM
ncbi:hypothetical protein AAFF_G00111740 [Aldrovandia affinis]|uniref:Transcription factor IIIC subunit 5 HTH domain-containing protein n=1 Tax=Aldrovandia affinis TaxID=143900 RepID=A0AAD7WAY3_9TELE|nr:hypothetical protein AAFF_G00111740 [Aldrovandia affinis]